MQAMEISRTGLDVEWRRLEIIAENIANASTTLDATGKPYRALELLSGPAQVFGAMVGNGTMVGNEPALKALRGVKIYSIEAQNIPPRRVYEPSHPQADAQGYVSYPGINHAAEMALMVKTSRAYEANIVAMKAAQQMYAKALEIGKSA